ncbi:MAG: type II toxin-antitoxin system HicB family antitoxin [Coriobacteriales bacterium]
MANVDEYMELFYPIQIVEDSDEGGYVASYPDLPGCITVGETPEGALINAEDARREWFTAAIEEGVEIPEPRDIESYSGVFVVRIPKSLHRSLALHAKREGMSLNRYCIYLLAKNDTLESIKFS